MKNRSKDVKIDPEMKASNLTKLNGRFLRGSHKFLLLNALLPVDQEIMI